MPLSKTSSLGVPVQLSQSDGTYLDLMRNPEEAIDRAVRIANKAATIIRDKRLYQPIGGKNYVLCEGWQTLGALVGVVAVVTSCDKTQDGYQARAEARTANGMVIGAGYADCDRTEKQWQSRENYALKSMAQTRANAKALRGCLAWIIKLAGFEPQPAEEMQ